MDTIELTTTVLPGGRIEVADPRLKEGESMKLTLEPRRLCPSDGKPTMTELLKLPLRPEDRCFQTPEEVDAYLDEERNSWDREISS